MASEDDDIYHFVAYTPINNVLYELDGLQPAPISHGRCSFEDFSENIIPVLQRRIQRYPANEIRFNLMAMVRDLRLRARETGDYESLAREEQRRNVWRWENALRRHNFIGFTHEMLKGVMRDKFDQGTTAYDDWIKEAEVKTKARIKKNGRSKESREKGQESDIGHN